MKYNEDDVKIVKVADIHDPLFEKANQLFINSFIEDERRNLQEVISQNKKFHLFAALYHNEFVAAITIWELSNLIFAENEAILQSNDTLWKIIFKKFFHIFPHKMIIIEVDRPIDDVAKNRIEFYKSIGYHLNTYEYIQPPYSLQKSPVPLYLMSYPMEISQEKYSKIRDYIYEHVYNTPRS